MMSVFYMVSSYAIFFYVGGLLMRLVVVQPLSNANAVRWCFASTFALSLSLFSAVLVDMAEASLFPSAAAAAAEDGADAIAAADGKWVSWLSTVSLFLHPFMQVNAQSFTWLLLFLLSTVLLACPTVFIISFLRHALVHGGGRRTAGRRCCNSRRPSGGMRGFGGLSAGRSCSRRFSSRPRSELSSPFQQDWEDTKPSHEFCKRLRWALMCLLVMSLICAGAWAARTRRLSVPSVRQTTITAARRVYTQLQSRTTMLNVPQEIRSTGASAMSGGAAAPSAPQAVAQEGKDAEAGLEVEADRVMESFAGAKGEVPGDGSDVSGQAQPPQQPRRRSPVADAAHSIPTTAADLHALVCAVTSRVATVGVAMIGLLSGYAAITSPCLFVAPYTYWRGREEELRKAQQNFNKKLCYVLNGYGAAQRQIAALQYGVLHEEWASPVFSSADSPSPHRGRSLSPLRQSPTLHSVGGGGDPLTHYRSLYPGSKGSSGISDYPAKGGLPGESDSWQSPGLGNQPPLSYVPPLQAQHRGSTGAVGWLQQTLSNAAQIFAGGTSGVSPGSCVSPRNLTSVASNPALSRQRAIACITTLRGESNASRFLSLSMYLQLREVEGMLCEAQRGATWVGRWYAGLGVVMGLYSAVKICLTVASLWLFKASTLDPVTRAVMLLEKTFILRRRVADGDASFSVTAVEVSAHVILALALVVNGWMIVNSIRGVLLALFHVTMSFSGSAISRPDIIAVGLSMMIGVYFIGQLVMLRSSLPGTVASPLEGVPPPAGTASPNVLLAVLGSLPYYYYQRLNDWCFVVGCGGAVVVHRFVLHDTVSSVVYTASGGEEQYPMG
ncbi:The Golgi pH Regulator [Leishmania braziliensis]|nr:The Golgi pH Regulator [Leishmania braziliensis]